MRLLVPVLSKSLELLKAKNPNLVEKKIFIRGTNGRKGHYRMQWTLPDRPGAQSTDPRQLDLFSEDAPVNKPESKTTARGKRLRELKSRINEIIEGIAATTVHNIKLRGEMNDMAKELENTLMDKMLVQDGINTMTDAQFDKEVSAWKDKIEKKAGSFKLQNFSFGQGDGGSSIDDDRAEALMDMGGKYAQAQEKFAIKMNGKPKAKNPKEENNKKKSKPESYEIKHDTFTGAVDEVIANLGKQGLYLDTDDVWSEISTGKGKPKNGGTNRYNLPLYDKDGKPAKKGVAFQVSDLGSKFELNMYQTAWGAKDYNKDKVEPWLASKDNKQDAGGFDPEKHIKAYADSWEKLRKDDVYRVLEESKSSKGGDIKVMADAIKTKRPDLAEEVSESMEDLGFPVAQKNDTPKGDLVLFHPFRTNVLDMVGAKGMYSDDGQPVKIERPGMDFVVSVGGKEVYRGDDNMTASSVLNRYNVRHVKDEPGMKKSITATDRLKARGLMK